MLAPNRYIVHMFLAYPEYHRGINPELFATKVRSAIGGATGGKAHVTTHLPFGVFMQTYHERGFPNHNRGIALVTLFLTAREYVDEDSIKALLVRAFFESGGSGGNSRRASTLAGTMSMVELCGSAPTPSLGTNIRQFGRFENAARDYYAVSGCVSFDVDSGVTSDTFMSRVWNVAFSGYGAWQHTTTETPGWRTTDAQGDHGIAQPPQPVPIDVQHPPPPAPLFDFSHGELPPQTGGVAGPNDPATNGGGGGGADDFWKKPWVKPAIGVAGALIVIGILYRVGVAAEAPYDDRDDDYDRRQRSRDRDLQPRQRPRGY